MNDAAPDGPLDKPLAKEDVCPRCLGELDTGWECNSCGFDAKELARSKGKLSEAADERSYKDLRDSGGLGGAP